MSELKSCTVTGDIGVFKGGDVLTSRKLIADYYRTATNEGADAETKLTDEQILALVDKIDGDNEDAEVERVILIERESAKVPA